MSPLPFPRDGKSRTSVQMRATALQQRLKPTTLFYRGQPHTYVLSIWTYLFPSATLLVCSESGIQTIEAAAEGFPAGMSTRWDAWEKRLRQFEQTFFAEHAGGLMKPEQVLQLRYRQHYAYVPMDAATCQRFYVPRAVTERGNIILEHDILRVSPTFRERHIIPELVSDAGRGLSHNFF